MDQSSRWIGAGELEFQAVARPKRQSLLKFLMRYPIFLLAFGPPVFRSALHGVDTSQSHFDFSNVLQVLWLFSVALRASIRLARARSVAIARKAQSVLKYAFFLGLLFLASIAYSPGREISAEFGLLYFLNLICVLEFVVDAYRAPPDWMQCILHLRQIGFVLCVLVFATAIVAPNLVVNSLGERGVRLMGGSIAAMPAICPMIAIISAYTFLHRLESRLRSALFFIVGLAGTLITQARGAEASLAVILAILIFTWAKVGKRSARLVMGWSALLVLFVAVVIGMIGGDRIWDIFNRGQDISGILTATGRTGQWMDLVSYCIPHPQGLGYIAGVRTFKGGIYTSNLHVQLNVTGGTDNSYLETLGDAGWLALALYLMILAKTVAVGMRFAKKSRLRLSTSDISAQHALRCALFLLAYFLMQGIESSQYVIPMQQPFYIQNILIAMILGACSSFLIASGTRSSHLSE